MKTSNDHKKLWVSPEVTRGIGTFDEPYSLGQALERVQPGNTIILKHGVYSGDKTIQCSGTIDKPIRITAQQNATVEISKGCWYFYDTSDLIVSGLIFKNSPSSAIAVMGACTRNSFQSLRFSDCGSLDKASATIFIGGAGGRCNVIEHCSFMQSESTMSPSAEPIAVGIMIAEGDADQEDGLILDHVIRYNGIQNYDCGIMVGTRGNGLDHFGHVVENNVLRNCALDGIKINCGDTEVRGNTIVDCGNRGIWIATGTASSVEENRLERCSTGIQVLSAGHILQNNCIVDSIKQAVHVNGIAEESDVPQSTIIIEQNSLIQYTKRACGDVSVTGVLMDSPSSCVIRKNLIFGQGSPYVFAEEPEQNKKKTVAVIQDNLVGGQCEAKQGCAFKEITFTNAGGRDFGTQSGYGAHGWITAADTDRVLDVSPGEGNPELLTEEELTEVERLITDVNREEVVKRSLFGPEDEENGESYED
ncbi:MAG: right-handed parallel beta-helix repeat-containing protein [Chitinispirillaceae bacterium]